MSPNEAAKLTFRRSHSFHCQQDTHCLVLARLHLYTFCCLQNEFLHLVNVHVIGRRLISDMKCNRSQRQHRFQLINIA